MANEEGRHTSLTEQHNDDNNITHPETSDTQGVGLLKTPQILSTYVKNSLEQSFRIDTRMQIIVTEFVFSAL